MTSIYLASTSPQRRALLTQLGITFKVIAPQIREEHHSEASAPTITHLVRRNALKKAQEVARRLTEGLVIGGDTLVVTNRGKMLGKAKTSEEALVMLRLLSGTWHRVLSAVALVDAKTSTHKVAHASTIVFFRKVSDATLQKYVKTQEPLEKAGAYAIQGKGGFLVEKINGSYSAVVGLPLELVAELLDEFGIPLWNCWNKEESSRV
ncbi:MAG: Maf family protein [Promethearchaeota archaeon]